MAEPKHTTKVALVCETCGMTFYRYPSAVSRARCCSRACFAVLRQNRVQRACAFCGEPFIVPARAIAHGGGK